MKLTYILFALLGLGLLLIYGILDPARYPFPSCPFRSLTGWLCPGCGSQRAIHHALHGRFGLSFQLNQLFLPGILYALIGYTMPFVSPDRWIHIRRRFYGIKAAWTIAIIIVVFWIVRNLW